MHEGVFIYCIHNWNRLPAYDVTKVKACEWTNIWLYYVECRKHLWQVLKLIPYTRILDMRAHANIGPEFKHAVLPPIFHVIKSFSYSLGSSGRLEPDPEQGLSGKSVLRIQAGAVLKRGAQGRAFLPTTVFGIGKFLHPIIDSNVIHTDLS